MILENHFENVLTYFMNNLGLAWWVEITTTSPSCIYYFGPFVSAENAATEQGGYIEDLAEEWAQGITVLIKRCKPRELTIVLKEQ